MVPGFVAAQLILSVMSLFHCPGGSPPTGCLPAIRHVTSLSKLLPLALRELLLMAIARSSGTHAVSKEAESQGSRLRNGEQHHDLPNAHKIYSQMLCVLLHFKSLSQFLPSGIVLLNNSSLESKWNNFVKTHFTLPCFS